MVAYILMLAASSVACAQYAKNFTSTASLGRDYTIGERFSYRTNVVDWLFTIPNVGIEFDLSKSQYNRSTLGLTAKYNWNTFHRYAPSSVVNLIDIRPEYRYYYRYNQRKSLSPEAAKDWRARYLGAYVDYANYSMKFGKATGYQGDGIGFGLSWGYDVPRYQYSKCAIDVEFGFSVGLFVTKYEAYTHTTDGYFYVSLPEKSKGWHLTPFPVISEAKVAFVLRPVSVERKYVKDDPRIKQYELAKSDVKSYFSENGSINKARFEMANEDGLAALKAEKKLYSKAFREYVDSEAATAESSAAALLGDDDSKAKLHRYTEWMKSGALIRTYFEWSKEFSVLDKQRRLEARKARAEKAAAKKADREAKKQSER